MSTNNRRKNKIPQRRDTSEILQRFSMSLSESSDNIMDTNGDANNLGLFCNEDRIKYYPKEEEIENNPTQLNLSAINLIHRFLPHPPINISNNSEISLLYNEIGNICSQIDDKINRYMKLFAANIINSLPPVSSSSTLSSVSTTSSPNSVSTNQDKRHHSNTFDTTNTNSSSLFIDSLPMILGLSNSQSISTNPTPTNSNHIASSCDKDRIALGAKKKTFRGTSDEENQVDPNYKPREINDEVVLSSHYDEIRVGKELYQMMLLKCSNSATRLIRLLMKNFFSQKVLAASSLSGEGYYKQKLNTKIISAIKDFIKQRHPKLKNGSINLCMTDVCVQARRVCRSKVSINQNSK